MKRDYNYIAAVEKAISEKYGKDTVQDFRNDWQESKEKIYLQQLKDRRYKLNNVKNKKRTVVVGDIEVRTTKSSERANRSCPVCKTYSFSSKDDLYMNRFQCCEKCFVEHVEYREELWTSGWRPGDGEWKPPFFKRFFRASKVFLNKFIRRIKKWLVFWT